MNKDYNFDDLQELSIAEAIHRRPLLYFEKCFKEQNLDTLPFEVLCHAFDEYFDDNCNSIEIRIANDSFTIAYNSGISLVVKNGEELTKAEKIMTQLFACRSEKKHLAVGEEFCSLGIATINYASERCELTTIHDNKKGHFVFENGKITSKVIDSLYREKDHTIIFIKPNKLLFGNLTFSLKGILEKAKQINTKLNKMEIAVIDEMSLR